MAARTSRFPKGKAWKAGHCARSRPNGSASNETARPTTSCQPVRTRNTAEIVVTPGHSTREHGFALVTVLWSAMIFALIAASVLTTSRTETRLTRYRQQAAECDAVADAALNLAILRLLDPAAPRPP